jgi:sugar (pentulose or hexulose) kinase
MRILSDMFGVRMVRPKNLQHIGALGAALIAGAGLAGSLDTAGDILQVRDSVEPEKKQSGKYQKLLPVVRKFYEGVLPAYRELSRIDRGN